MALNAKLCGWGDLDEEYQGEITIPQNASVLDAPSLRWFRSDLTPENMDMLRIKRPVLSKFYFIIIFLNTIKLFLFLIV